MTYVSMRLPLSGLAHDFAECAGGAPAGFVNASTAASQGYVELRVYFGFTADATFPFGANNTVTAAANSTKFSVEAASWCVHMPAGGCSCGGVCMCQFAAACAAARHPPLCAA